MNLGVFGGAFDPPHLAHRAVIEACHAQFALHRVLLLPSGRHPFKGEGQRTDDARLALCRLAFLELAYVDVDDRELRRAGVPIEARALDGLDLNATEKAGLLAHVAQVNPSDLSSTELRRRLGAGEDTKAMLAPSVQRAVARQGLYR